MLVRAANATLAHAMTAADAGVSLREYSYHIASDGHRCFARQRAGGERAAACEGLQAPKLQPFCTPRIHLCDTETQFIATGSKLSLAGCFGVASKSSRVSVATPVDVSAFSGGRECCDGKSALPLRRPQAQHVGARAQCSQHCIWHTMSPQLLSEEPTQANSPLLCQL